jgi:hypothetical protein
VLYQLSYLGSLRWIVLVALDGVKKEGVGVGLRCPLQREVRLRD